MAFLRQVGGEPRNVELPQKGDGEGDTEQTPDALRSQQFTPIRHTVGFALRNRFQTATGTYEFLFRSIHRPMGRGFIPIPEKPGRRCRQAEQPEQPKHCAPTESEQQKHGQWGSHRTAPKRPPLKYAPKNVQALGDRGPAGEGGCGRGRQRGFQSAEDETDSQHRNQAARRAGESREDRPANDRGRDDPPRAEAIRSHTPRHLPQRVRETEDPEDQPHPRWRESEIPGYDRSCRRNAHPVRVAHQIDGSGKPDD